MSTCCEQDDRREAVRRKEGWNGLDYVEVGDDQRTLTAYFLGKLPLGLANGGPEATAHLRVEGGQRVTNIRVMSADSVIDPDPERDDSLVVKVDKAGDWSTYTLRLVGLKQIDPRYDRAGFSFKVNCPSDMDCAPSCACEPETRSEPDINYLAKDYASFKQVIFDRLAVLMPDWKERHAPDIGVALVELLAYTGDYLSYYQDAVGTEAYLDTARRRISVRRHARLVDYCLHEGCNARAFVCIEAEGIGGKLDLDSAKVSFITALNDALVVAPGVLDWDSLREVPVGDYEVFEPMALNPPAPITLRTAHNEIRFYTWGQSQCCLERGSTAATLIDAWAGAEPAKDSPNTAAPRPRSLQLAVGDILIFEEVRGPGTGLAADADPLRRHPVRLTKVSPSEDPIFTDQGDSTPLVEIEWAVEDALPFTFCVSTIGSAPQCQYIDNVSVAHGNVVLVDHGRTTGPEDLGTVPTDEMTGCCECAGRSGDIELAPGCFGPTLRKVPLTFRQPLPAEPSSSPPRPSAAALLVQDVRRALPDIDVTSVPSQPWRPKSDLIGSRSGDHDVVVEIDNEAVAHLRFDTGDLCARPSAGMTMSAVYRVGNGTAGNVGAESISRLVLAGERLSGVSLTVRNPLPASGGTDPEPLAEARLFAPFAFRKRIERAIIAADYAELAERNPKIQRASAELTWTGSWTEADVSLDPFGREDADRALLAGTRYDLARYRRMGHDLVVDLARYVPVDLALEVCALPAFEPAHVKAALLEAFGTRVLPDGTRGFFHPDNLTFGDGVYLSRIVTAAQRVPGVECARVTVLNRLLESPNQELENGVLPVRHDEIAQLDNDPNFPERGRLVIHVGGGR